LAISFNIDTTVKEWTDICQFETKTRQR